MPGSTSTATGVGDRIANGAAVNEGDNTLSFDVPSWAASRATYARFRLSTSGNLAPSGLAGDGEVEDYLVAIDPPAASSGVFSTQNILSTAADGARSVFAADMDGDGDMDVLSASRTGGIAWYENDGGEGFTRHTISTTTNFAKSVFAIDVNGDGDIDVLSASLFDDKITWYKNDGSENFTAHTISTDADLAQQPLILFERGSTGRQHVIDAFHAASVSPLVDMETTNTEIIVSLVEAGLGVSIVPLLPSGVVTRGRRVEIRSLGQQIRPIHSGVLYRRAEKRSEAAAKFFEFVVREFEA